MIGPMSLDAALVWFRRDLRDRDHAALYHALKGARQIGFTIVSLTVSLIAVLIGSFDWPHARGLSPTEGWQAAFIVPGLLGLAETAGLMELHSALGVGGKDPMNAQSAGFTGGGGASLPRGFQIVGRAIGHGMRKESGVENAHGGAAFKVRAHNQRIPGLILHSVEESGKGMGFRAKNLSAGDAI